MPRGLDDAVRAYQLPTPAPAQLYLSQYNLASNGPIYVTPGFGGGGGSQNAPKPVTGQAHFEMTVTQYMDQAAVERSRSGSIF